MNRQGPGKIGWTDYTWNYQVGCNRGCEYCYGRTRSAPRLSCPQCRAYEPHVHPERLREPLRVRKPSKIFVSSIGELFGPWVPQEWVENVLGICRETPWHIFQFLTKYPENLAQYNPFPSNVLVGATATDNPSTVTALDGLYQLQAGVKYISFEPLMDKVCYRIRGWSPDNLARAFTETGISWVIVGPLNGKMAVQYPMERSWAEDIERAADMAGVAIFEKRECARVITDRPLRQEFPIPKGMT